ncbi:MAG: hypothetical protein HY840_04660 [Bacteroidetes bacterium]|nr:hypothetical protein [Bacteroidota bacterium]
MKIFSFFFIWALLLHFHISFAQTDSTKKNKLNMSVGLLQSIVYIGNMNYYTNNNDDDSKYCYSPGVSLEYRFLKNYLAVFGGIEYYAIKGNNKSHYMFISEGSNYFTYAKWIQNIIEVPLGLKVYFLKDNFRIQPYLSIGTLLKYTSVKSDITYFDIPTSKIFDIKNVSNYRYNKATSCDQGLNFILLSIGSDYKFKNSFLLNFEMNTKYNCLFSNNYILGISFGIKYGF